VESIKSSRRPRSSCPDGGSFLPSGDPHPRGEGLRR
jgi:hypothetical protein